jgi:hypothetical protein
VHANLYISLVVYSNPAFVAHISMENYAPGSVFPNSHISRFSLHSQSIVYPRRLQIYNETAQFKALIQSLRRIGPHLKTSDSLRVMQNSRPQSRNRPFSGCKPSTGVKGLRQKTRERMQVRAQSASFFQQRSASALSITDSTSLEGKSAILCLKSHCLRSKLTPARSCKPLLQESNRPCSQLSPRDRFRKAVAAAAASFSTEEVSGWA